MLYFAAFPAVSEAVGHVNGASFVLLATVVLRNSVI
jgi:hypothetical protein